MYQRCDLAREMACPVRVSTRGEPLKNHIDAQENLNANNSEHNAADSDAQKNGPVKHDQQTWKTSVNAITAVNQLIKKKKKVFNYTSFFFMFNILLQSVTCNKAVQM